MVDKTLEVKEKDREEEIPSSSWGGRSQSIGELGERLFHLHYEQYQAAQPWYTSSLVEEDAGTKWHFTFKTRLPGRIETIITLPLKERRQSALQRAVFVAETLILKAEALKDVDKSVRQKQIDVEALLKENDRLRKSLAEQNPPRKLMKNMFLVMLFSTFSFTVSSLTSTDLIHPYFSLGLFAFGFSFFMMGNLLSKTKRAE